MLFNNSFAVQLASGNSTSITLHETAEWTGLIIAQLVVAAVSLPLNLVMLLYLLWPPSQITPFSLYLVILMATNCVFLAMETPLAILRDLYGYWWMGTPSCNLMKYLHFVFDTVLIWPHCLIAINRFWATAFPHSYRRYHTRTMVCCIYLGILAWSHVFALPGFMLDATYYSLGPSNGCNLNLGIKRIWAAAQVEHALGFVLPMAMVILIYIYLLRKRFMRRTVPENGHHSASAQLSRGVVPERSTTQKKIKSQRRKEALRPFLVVTLTVVSVSITWTPCILYFLVAYDFYVWWSPEVLAASLGIFSLQMMFDPVIVACSSREIMLRVRKVFRK